MTHTATSLSSWAKAIKTTLDKRGLNSAQLFEQAGLDLAALNKPSARYPLAGTTKLWELAIAATGDECLGISVARNVNQTTFHALGYSVLASKNLHEVFARIVRYFRLVTDAGDIAFVPIGSDYKFVINPVKGQTQPAQAAIDAFMAVIVNMCRLLTRNQFHALTISFKRQATENLEPFEQAFGPHLAFEAEENAIYMSDAILSQTLETANSDLARHNDEILTKHLQELDKENILMSVHSAIKQQLSQGEPSQEKIAADLHLSPRNLQRKLAAEGSSYKAVLNQTRHDLALVYLSQERLSISEAAFLLGFSDTSSFTRAFKRWTGQSPKAHQKQTR